MDRDRASYPAWGRDRASANAHASVREWLGSEVRRGENRGRLAHLRARFDRGRCRSSRIIWMSSLGFRWMHRPRRRLQHPVPTVIFAILARWQDDRELFTVPTHPTYLACKYRACEIHARLKTILPILIRASTGGKKKTSLVNSDSPRHALTSLTSEHTKMS